MLLPLPRHAARRFFFFSPCHVCSGCSLFIFAAAAFHFFFSPFICHDIAAMRAADAMSAMLLRAFSISIIFFRKARSACCYAPCLCLMLPRC